MVERVTPIPVILDTDPGIDDAAAIVLALAEPAIDVRLITTVAGNVDVDKTTRNALTLVEFMGASTPVARGASQPLIRPFEDASYVHGVSGMDGYAFDPVTREPLAVHAVEAMRACVEASSEPVTLLAVGSLTNVALFIRMYPTHARQLKEIIIMGGSLGIGNTQSVSEFNIYADPHAAQIVFEAGLPLTMVGLNVTHQALLTQANAERISQMNPAGAMLYQLFTHYDSGDHGGDLEMHDPCVIYYLLHRDRCQVADYYVDIQLDGPAMGATVVDTRRAYHTGTNCTVALAFDVAHFNEWYLTTIQSI